MSSGRQRLNPGQRHFNVGKTAENSQYRAIGRETTGSGSRLQLLSGKPEVERTIQVNQNVRSSADQVSVSADPDSLVEVELENGVVFWTSLQRLQEDASGIGQRSADKLDLPTRYPAAGAVDRGIVGIAIKSLNFLGYKVADDLPEKAVEIAAERVEQQLAGPTGIYRIGPNGELTPDSIEAGTEPVLVFIHGTASSTTNGFKALTGSEEQAPAWARLQEHYKGRIFGYEHRTLTQFPAENAVEFLESLPDGNIPPLHLVSHSRGGLVGDLIAHGGLKETAFPVADLKAAGIDEKQIPVFNRLNELLATRAPRVTRFVRIACPAGGTTLASGRLDIYLSLMVTLLGKIPAVGPILGAVGDLLATAAKLRTDPDALPGLEAQMPDSPFIRILNGSGHQLDSDLTVISGDSDGWLKNLANLFYWTANDLVVDTRSMYRGAVRAKRSWYRAEGPEVHHCNYFARDETVQKLVDGLTRSDTADGGFAITEPRSVQRGALHPTAPEDHTEQPAVILIPGVMGSHLSVPVPEGRNRIWLDIPDLIRGGIDRLDINDEDVSADAVVGSAYADLADFLRKQELHVIPFPYDWRISLADSAAQLRDLVNKRQQASDEPVTLVAHSMGGIVARHFIADCQQSGHDEWNEIVRRDGRLIQLGTPNGGSYLIPYLLQGKEKILKYLAALDLRNSRKDWVKVIARYPGLHEMSPQSATHDFFKVSTWSDLGVLTKPLEQELNAAKSVVDKLRSVDLSTQPVLYVAGKSDSTPDMQAGDDEIKFTQRGDGRVTWDSGIPKGVKHWFVDTAHGDLANHRKSFPGLLDLIKTGTTEQLSNKEPASKREIMTQRLIDDDGVQVFPTQESIEKAALGMSDTEDWQESVM
jgi:pimeloyl-ACP methyl ester carboxylesterase